jgi:hypothetical protein
METSESHLETLEYKTYNRTTKLPGHTCLSIFMSYFMMLSVLRLYSVRYKFSIQRVTGLILIIATNLKNKNKQTNICQYNYNQ